MLKQMLARVSRAEEFRISLADIKAGRRAAGQQSPLTDYSVERKPKKKETWRSWLASGWKRTVRQGIDLRAVDGTEQTSRNAVVQGFGKRRAIQPSIVSRIAARVFRSSFSRSRGRSRRR